jgi:hypothetical protein
MAARFLYALLLALLPSLADAAERAASDAQSRADELRFAPAVTRGASLREMIGASFRSAARRRPEWVQDTPSVDLHAEERSLGDDSWQLVLQQERRDGAKLLTFRYPLAPQGPVQAYAGAGLNRVVYYAEDDYGFTRFSRRSRHSSLGAAAEIGAELDLGRELRLGADLRWAEMDARAVALHSEGLLVAADQLVLGVSMGWRF